jgi:hypothetical protein
MATDNLKKNIQQLITILIIGLILSGLTALPIEWQLNIAKKEISSLYFNNALTQWINLVYAGVHETNQKFPFISYGTDWLAFAHFMIAIAFIGPLRDPVRNIWVIEFGLIACLTIFPFCIYRGDDAWHSDLLAPYRLFLWFIRWAATVALLP